MNSIKERFEAPTDESWGKDFLFEFWRDYENAPTGDDRDKVIETYSSQLQKEREKDQKILDEYIDAQYEAGKSEAFSLVRKAITDYDRIKCGRCVSGDIQLHHILACTMRTDLLNQLSTLEGK